MGVVKSREGSPRFKGLWIFISLLNVAGFCCHVFCRKFWEVCITGGQLALGKDGQVAQSAANP